MCEEQLVEVTEYCNKIDDNYEVFVSNGEYIFYFLNGVLMGKEKICNLNNT